MYRFIVKRNWYTKYALYGDGCALCTLFSMVNRCVCVLYYICIAKDVPLASFRTDNALVRCDGNDATQRLVNARKGTLYSL